MSQRAERFPAKFPVVLRQGPELFPATICNISAGGGCILGSYTLAKGDTVMLDYAVGQTHATVMWSMARMSGLSFEHHVSNNSLDRIRALKKSSA